MTAAPARCSRSCRCCSRQRLRPLAPRACLSECTPRIGIVSAFGAEAAILSPRRARAHLDDQRQPLHDRRAARQPRRHRPQRRQHGQCGDDDAALIDHFRIERLVMSGIAGGIDPSRHVGDVLVPESWTMPMEVYWSHDARRPRRAARRASCSASALRSPRPRAAQWRRTWTGRRATAASSCARTRVVSAARPRVNSCSTIASTRRCSPSRRDDAPTLATCGPKANARRDASTRSFASAAQPTLVVGGRGVSGTAFLADPAYRRYLFEQLGAQSVDMETAAVAHVARATAFPSSPFAASAISPVPRHSTPTSARCSRAASPRRNASALTLAFLAAWAERHGGAARGR